MYSTQQPAQQFVVYSYPVNSVDGGVVAEGRHCCAQTQMVKHYGKVVFHGLGLSTGPKDQLWYSKS
jgi:hypothetical protein